MCIDIQKYEELEISQSSLIIRLVFHPRKAS